MNLVITLAAVTALATTAGGLLALRSRDRLHLILGLSAGLLLGLVVFDLLPEVFHATEEELLHVPVVSVAIVAGFLILHIVEQFAGPHEPVESDYGHEHGHATNIAGTLGALAMGGHVFLDGVALGVAFQVSHALGFAVFSAILVHAFSDGLNTVSLLIKGGHWSKRGRWLLLVDAVARIGGASLGSAIAISEANVALYLAVFAGMVTYLATSHILPEAHSRHPSKLTLLATVAGVGLMWILVANLGAH